MRRGMEQDGCEWVVSISVYIASRELKDDVLDIDMVNEVVHIGCDNTAVLILTLLDIECP